MYVAAYDGMQLSRAGAIEFVGVAEGDRLVGARMELEGIRFVLNLVSESPVPHLSSIAGMDPDWTAAELKRPFRKILFDHYSFPSHSVDFDWSVA